MPPQRNSRTSSSKNDDYSPVQLRFYSESGRTYRPFTDPKRIENNDAKKTCANDSRARVKGVPDMFLGVMDTGEEASSGAVNQVSTINKCNPVPYEPQQQSFQSAVSETQTLERFVNQNSSAANVTINNGHPMTLAQSLHVDIPDVSATFANQGRYYSPSSTSPESLWRSADGHTPISADGCFPADLVLPGSLQLQQFSEYGSRTDDSLQMPNYELINSALVTAPFLCMPACSPISDSRIESPASSSTTDSSESLVSCSTPISSLGEDYCGPNDHGYLGERPASHSMMPTSQSGSFFMDTGHQRLSGPTFVEPMIPSDESVVIPSLYDPFFSEDLEKIARTMNLDERDLAHLNVYHDSGKRGIFTSHANPDVFLPGPEVTDIQRFV